MRRALTNGYLAAERPQERWRSWSMQAGYRKTRFRFRARRVEVKPTSSMACADGGQGSRLPRHSKTMRGAPGGLADPDDPGHGAGPSPFRLRATGAAAYGLDCLPAAIRCSRIFLPLQCFAEIVVVRPFSYQALFRRRRLGRREPLRDRPAARAVRRRDPFFLCQCRGCSKMCIGECSRLFADHTLEFLMQVAANLDLDPREVIGNAVGNGNGPGGALGRGPPVPFLATVSRDVRTKGPKGVTM
jgi:hypothetical protein